MELVEDDEMDGRPKSTQTEVNLAANDLVKNTPVIPLVCNRVIQYHTEFNG
jgi:hypothetical protein